MPRNLAANRLPERIERTGEQSAGNPYTFIMASDAVDRAGDIIEMEGLDLAQFKRNPVALWSHDSASPIGTWENVKVAGGQLIGTLRLAAKGSIGYVDRLRELIEQRILRAVSVGFLPHEYAELRETGGLRFTRSELLECSLVSVPMNAEALRIKGLAPSPFDPVVRSILSGGTVPRIGPQPVTRAGGATAITRAPTSAPPGKGNRNMPTPISEKIVALQARSVAIDDELSALQANAENDNNRDFTEEETATVAALAEEKASVTRSIETNTTIERALAARAVPASHSPPATVPARPELKERPGSIIMKVGAAQLLAHRLHRSVDSVIGEFYRDDERVKVANDFILKSATAPATTLTPGWAAELVTEGQVAFISEVLATSVYQALASRGATLQFGNNGSIVAPRRTGQGNMQGAWVGETGVIPVVQGTLAASTFERYKLAAISTFSKELEQLSTPQIEQLIRDSISEDTKVLIDKNLLSTTAMRAGVRPAGILNGVAGIPSAGATQANINTDIKALIAGLGVNVGNVVLIMHPNRALGLSFVISATGEYLFKDDLANGNLFGRPVILSTNVPPDVVVAVNASDFATGLGTVMFDLSDTATLTMANADANPPTQAVTAAGVVDVANEVGPGLGISVAGGPAGAGTAGVEAVSMFQTWSTALRMVMPITWGMLRPGAVSWLSGVAW